MYTPRKTILVLSALAGMTSFSAKADVLELRNGTVLNGSYVGGTAGTIRLQTADGVQVIATTEALALTFTGGATPAAPAAPVPAAPPPPVAAASGPVTLNAGTVLLVRMDETVSSRDAKGKRFSTTLQTDLLVNGSRVVAAGSKVYGRVANVQQAGRLVGYSMLDLRLSDLTLGGSTVPIVTGAYAERGSGSGAKTVKAAGAGAIIGNNTGNGSSGDGAAIGVGVAALKKGETVVVSAGELLEFRLDQPVTIQLAP